jgi:hypothetical protein
VVVLISSAGGTDKAMSGSGAARKHCLANDGLTGASTKSACALTGRDDTAGSARREMLFSAKGRSPPMPYCRTPRIWMKGARLRH